jgi:hypothetical protein
MFGKASNQKKLDQLRQRAVALGRKRDEAKSALEEAAAARQQHHLEGDLEDLKISAKLQAQVDSAASTLRGLEDAVAALLPQVAGAERQLAAEQERAERKVASEKLGQEIAVLESKLHPWLEATRALADLWGKQTLRFEAGAIGRYLANAAGEVEVAANVTLVDLHGAVKAIGGGREAIPRPALILVETPALPPPTVPCFALRHVAWTDHHGTLRSASANTGNIALPEAAAERGLKSGAVVLMSDPKVKQLARSRAELFVPDPARCELLDDSVIPPSTVKTAKHSAFPLPPGETFEPLDRGPAYSMKAPPAPAVAARSITPDERDE